MNTILPTTHRSFSQNKYTKPAKYKDPRHRHDNRSTKKLCHQKSNDTCIGKDWNPNNKLLDRTFVENTIQRFCGTYIRIYDLRKYQLAFVHKSVKKRDISPPTNDVLTQIANAKIYGENIEPILLKYGTWNNGEPVIFTQDYEQIEFVGDGWIGSIVGDYLYSLFPRQGEGFYTQLKQNIVCKDGLASLSSHIGFDKYLLLSTRNELRYGRNNKSYLEDVFEAFCAAIKQDLGLPMLILFIKNAIESAMDFEYFITTDTNFKDTLMRFFQSNGWSQPKYPDIKEEGSMHHKKYTSGVAWINELTLIGLPPIFVKGSSTPFVATATHKSKKEAQKEAAQLALLRIKQFLQNNIQ